MPALITMDMIPAAYRHDVLTRVNNLSSGNRDALKSVLLVGARQKEDGQLDEIDTHYLRRFLMMCTDFRWPLHPLFSIHRANINDNRADDFLQIRTPFDAVVFCYLFHQHRERAVANKAVASEIALEHGLQADTYLQSPDHSQERSWHRRLKRLDVKVVGNVKSLANDLDLPNHWIRRKPYGCLGSGIINEAPSRALHIFASRRWVPAKPQFDRLRAS